MRTFNTTGLCVPEEDYMVDITDRLNIMKEMIGEGQYFTINRGRQYGKTTTLAALERYLQNEYYIVSMDFQDFGQSSFETEEKFCRDFTGKFCEIATDIDMTEQDSINELISEWTDYSRTNPDDFRLIQLFGFVTRMCKMSDKPIVLFIDEVDSATNNQVFLDFLAQLRSLYLKRKKNPKLKTFQSVILAGVTDVKNLKRKLRPDEAAKVNSPWNIRESDEASECSHSFADRPRSHMAKPYEIWVDFLIDMSLSAEGIAGMLSDYEEDHNTGMDVECMAQEIRDYTGGYPFLVCRICQILDSELVGTDRFSELSDTWTSEGINEAVRIILFETNTLFDSLMGKLYNNEELCNVLKDILFGGEAVSYNPDKLAIADARMYGFIKIENGKIVIANRIFETRLYNYFLGDSEIKSAPLYSAGSNDRDLFIKDGHLDMDKVLERFVISFDDLYGDDYATFDEDEGRRRFLLYIRPIINGTGNYYIEAQTRNNRRMDVVIDYLGERFVVELKIWRGNAYNERGEEQLSDYLDYFHIQKGYMLSYNFNRNKEVGVKTISVGDKVLVEAVV